MAQDNNDKQALHAQLWKARATWAQVGQVLQNENTSLFIAARFYQAVVQAIFLYGSETWVISHTAMVQLKGFTSKLRIEWQRCSSRSGVRGMSGYIQDRRMS